MSALTPASRIKRGRDVLHRELEGEAVLVDLGTGRFYGLDEVGMRVWHGLGRETRVSTLVDRVVKEFEVSRPRAEKDLLALLRELARRRLVTVRPAGR
jgi:hypothetical protein